MAVVSDQITFPGAEGVTLAGRLDRPPGPVRAYALFAHCFTCSKDVFAAARIASTLAGQGIAVLRFDFTGLGASGGDFANTDFSSNVQDLVAAADFMRDRMAAPSILIGHSLGGAAVLGAAAHIPETKAVATIGAPADPVHVEHLLADARSEIDEKGEAEVVLAGRRFRIKKRFLEDIAGQRLTDSIAGLKKALLVVHAPRDEIVGIDNASRIFMAAKHPKSFLSLDDADHLLTRRSDAVYAARVVGAWAARYAAAEDEATAPKVEQGTVVVTETGEGKFATIISDGVSTIRADEPPDAGGLNSGMTPYGLLQAALGACTSMTLRMYAERKSWPLEKVTVRLRHDKIHAEDCAECETKVGKIDSIERKLTVAGDLSAEQRQRLLEIADKCPVHRTLQSEVRIETALAD